jgi:nitric-oxide synthase, bacterial
MFGSAKWSQTGLDSRPGRPLRSVAGTYRNIRRPGVVDWPEGLILEVPSRHPDHPWFEALQLKWYALPALSGMLLQIGGVKYPAAPFSGWYVGTEVGARDLADIQRYNVLPMVGKHLGLDTKSDRSLWKDRALVELNAAVLHSFAQAGVAMVDHHTVARQFMLHEEREMKAGRTDVLQVCSRDEGRAR